MCKIWKPCVFVCLLATAPEALTDTFNVPGDAATIQGGIDLAMNGDEVVVAPGTYNEIIDTLGKAITVRSSGGAAVTTIDATGVPDPGDGVPVVRIDNAEGSDTVLDGFTITGGTGDSAKFAGTRVGGGMFCDIGVSPTITNCIFTTNSAEVGGGLFTNEASPTVTDCVFIGNDVPNSGGAAFCYTSGAPAFTRCRFEINTALYGGALYLDGVAAIITNCDFIGNAATGVDGSGGGVLATGFAEGLVIDSCRFLGNTSADIAGGLVIANIGSTTMTNCVVSGNSAASDGGGLYLSGDNLTMANCTFVGNTAGGNGGGIRAPIGATGTAVTCVLWGNTDLGGMDNSAQLHGTNNLVPTYCIVQGGVAGDGNLDADPLFVDADGPDNLIGTDDDDLQLSAGSPAIDSGDTVSAGTAMTSNEDLDGNTRLTNDPATPDTGIQFLGVTIDRGAYEYQVASSSIGACCLPLGECVVTTEDDCLAAGGSYNGDGTDCGSVNCAPSTCAAEIGDMNCDGAFDLFDIDAFVLKLTDPGQYAIQFPDCNTLCP